MATWFPFDSTEPTGDTDATAVATATRQNDSAAMLWNVAITGSVPGWNSSDNANGTSIPWDRPTEIYARKGPASTAGSPWIRTDVTYGVSGAALDLPITFTYWYSDDGGNTYAKMTHEGMNRVTITYYSTGQRPTTVWSFV